MPVVPFIPAIIGAVSAVGSAIHGSASQQQIGGTPGGAGGQQEQLRNFVMKMLMGNSTPTAGPTGMLTANPAASLAGTNGLFEATRASALGQAKESAGNLTGSGYNNLFGSALAQSLAAQQKQLADTTLSAQQGNQQTWAQLFSQFGNQGVGAGEIVNKPSFFSQLGQLAGPAGAIAGMYGARGTPNGGVNAGNVAVNGPRQVPLGGG